jgi:hypothetical protein
LKKVARPPTKLERQARRLAKQRVLHEPFEIDYLGDDLFTVGVPALAPAGFRHAVASAARGWLFEDPVLLAALQPYGGVELFQPPKGGYYPLFRDIAYFVVRHIRAEIDRIGNIPRVPDQHGVFAAQNALVRLQSSYFAACALMRQYLWVEFACILKLILEQLAWSYAVRDLEGPKLFATKPSNGFLNHTAHISPNLTAEYIEFGMRVPTVFLASAKYAARCAYFLLLTTDIYLLVSEFVHEQYYVSFNHLRPTKRGAVSRERRKFLSEIMRFRRRLFSTQARNPLR